MRQKLILHIGTHKTGSTTIQNYFYFNRLWMRFWGVFYPRPVNGPLFFSNNHSDLRDTARAEGQPKNPHTHPEFGPHDALLGRYLLAIKDAGCPVNILSCEGWSSHLNRYATRLAPLRQHFDVKVICFMRRPDVWVERFYGQRIVNIEHNETTPFDEFIAQPPMERYLFDRASILEWWAEAFGPENIEVIPFVPAEPDFDLLDRFFAACGINFPATRFMLFRNSRANPSLPAADIEAIRSRRCLGEDVTQAEIKRLKRRARGRSHDFLSQPDRVALLKRAGPDIERIRAKYVRDRGGALFGDLNDL